MRLKFHLELRHIIHLIFHIEICQVEKTPMLIQTAIMPFNGMIIYDGFISTADMQLSQELISKAFEDYSFGQKIYSLLPKNMN